MLIFTIYIHNTTNNNSNLFIYSYRWFYIYTHIFFYIRTKLRIYVVFFVFFTQAISEKKAIQIEMFKFLRQNITLNVLQKTLSDVMGHFGLKNKPKTQARQQKLPPPRQTNSSSKSITKIIEIWEGFFPVADNIFVINFCPLRFEKKITRYVFLRIEALQVAHKKS